jgi:hypothetical protein
VTISCDISIVTKVLTETTMVTECDRKFSAEGRRVQTCDQESRPKTRTDRTCTCVLRVIISGCIRS